MPLVPAHVLHATCKQSSASPAQWLPARSGSAMYLAFRGTGDVQDAAIDSSAVPGTVRFKEHGVHSGIANAVEQEGDEVDHVVEDILQVVSEHRDAGEPLVLCGHSLGGGYAQVMAVHLLRRDVSVSAVRTSGAPHVLVPPRAGAPQQLWQRLHAITQHWVHDWDPVPRLPLCKSWLVDVLPKLKQEIAGGIRAGRLSRKLRCQQRPSVGEVRCGG
ncbi:yiaY [Symbiodinium natans]|uniref:YiaY protein n=1 Tax=Symbiodinium natans TaxID=878477 RepID=A0A812JB38_9DINO|nr:yiaY [Symbiodinium natans]